MGDAQRGLDIVADYTAGTNRVHMCYGFDFLSPEKISAGKVRRVLETFEAVASEGWSCWAFSNHDVVRHASRWAREEADPQAYVKVVAAVLMSLRGSVCIYQGEELGLGEADLAYEDLRDPYGIRFWPEFRGRDGLPHADGLGGEPSVRGLHRRPAVAAGAGGALSPLRRPAGRERGVGFSPIIGASSPSGAITSPS